MTNRALTIADLANGKRDLETIAAVANSPADSTSTRFGDSISTLSGVLRRLGYAVPVPYAPGLSVTSGLTTVERNGVIYAPRVELLPFTTGAWNSAQWRVVQNTSDENRVYQFATLSAAQAAAAQLPEGSAVFVDGVSQGTVAFGAYVPDRGAPAGALSDYADLRAYSGSAAALVLTSPMVSGPFYRRGVALDNGATVIKDALGRSWERGNADVKLASWWGISSAGDQTTNIRKLFDSLQDFDTVDFAGARCKVYEGVVGVASGDALPLNQVLRIEGRTGITLLNGEIYAASPGVSPTVVRFPTTLTFDGCTSPTLRNFICRAKGESFGDVDASEPLGSEARRAFGAQNGGHALLVVRTRGYRGDNVKTYGAGSCGAFYSMSSSGSILNACYSSAKSLGYAAYAADSWAGAPAVSGFLSHDITLNSCSTDADGGLYGSKGCIVAEDEGVLVKVNGGSYKDAYANGAGKFLGAAFYANVAKIIVSGAYVENCAAVGATMHSASGLASITAVGVVARKIRTSGHIQTEGSFGESRVRYTDCDVEVDGSTTWAGTPALSVSTFVSNSKVTSDFFFEIVGGRWIGAHTAVLNTRPCYGGVRISGGSHSVTARVLDSAGWGGSSSGSGWGFSIEAGAKIRVSGSSPAAVTDPAKSALLVAKNLDVGVYTYQNIRIAGSCALESAVFSLLDDVSAEGVGLQEAFTCDAELTGVWQNQMGVQFGHTDRFEILSLDGVAGGNVRVTVSPASGRLPKGGTRLLDNSGAIRTVTPNGVPVVVGIKVALPVYLSGSSYELTVGTRAVSLY